MKSLLVAALLASTCNTSAPSPAPGPTPVPTYTPAPDPSAPVTDCQLAEFTMGEAECPPAEGNDAWLLACAQLPPSAAACIVAAKSCAAMRACLE